MLRSILQSLLAYPSTRGIDLNDPHLTQLRRSIIQEKKFLKAIYLEWYQLLLQAIPDGTQPILELGSGAGFLSSLCPEVITSEIFWCDHTKATLDGCALPFKPNTLRAILMTDVLHHIPTVQRFFAEAGRCLIPGGVIAMIEPWSTRWSRFIYQRLHHEPFNPSAPIWDFPSSGPLSGANSALPWIIFQRDRCIFQNEFPSLTIERCQVMMPFRYLVSGGVSMRCLVPNGSYPIWKSLEQILTPWIKHLGMFALIIIQKKTE